jgi:hypothetical protein
MAGAALRQPGVGDGVDRRAGEEAEPVDSKPPCACAWSISSKLSAAINTPLPKAMTAATARAPIGAHQPIAAPSNNAEPVRPPQAAACIQPLIGPAPARRG